MDPGLYAGAILAFLFSFLSYRARFLTKDGAALQWLMGATLLGIGGWQWTLPMLTFFLPSSILSRLGRRRRQDADSAFAKTSRRDALQVLANGGVPWLLFLVFLFLGDERLFVAFAGSIAAATADTWGTEVGTLSGRKPVLVTTWKRVEAGRSGAVSMVGTMAGMLGGIGIAASAVLWAPAGPGFHFFFATAGGGAIASLLDSLVGATIQSQWRCPVCDRLTEREEHCGSPALLERGFRFISNDAVNLICTLAGALLSVFFFSIPRKSVGF